MEYYKQPKPDNKKTKTPADAAYTIDLSTMKNQYVSARQITIEDERGTLDKKQLDILSSSFANTIRYKGNVYHLNEITESEQIYTNSHNYKGKIETCDIIISNYTGKYRVEAVELVTYKEYEKKTKELEESVNRVKVDLTKKIEGVKDTTATSLSASVEESILTLELLNYSGVILSKEELELPSSSEISSIEYDKETESLIFIYKSGEKTSVSIKSLVDSFATNESVENLDSKIDSLAKLSLYYKVVE